MLRPYPELESLLEKRLPRGTCWGWAMLRDIVQEHARGSLLVVPPHEQGIPRSLHYDRDAVQVRVPGMKDVP
jgi:hypothetical protein